MWVSNNLTCNIQIHEWCHFMKLSRLEKLEPTTINVSICKCQLTSEEKSWLETHYYRKYPEYKDEYEIDKARNKRLNYKMNFPTKANWKPPTRSLLPFEETLLCGPPETVTLLKRTQLRNTSTGRLLTYSSKSHEEISSRNCSSYVCLNHNQQQQHKDPQFGCINKIFFHKFGDKTVIFAEVTKFSDTKFDTELRMWHASLAHANHSALYLIDDFSEPLTIALDTHNSFI